MLDKQHDSDSSCELCRYELQIITVRLLDFYGGAADLTPQEYFAAEVSCKLAAPRHFDS